MAKPHASQRVSIVVTAASCVLVLSGFALWPNSAKMIDGVYGRQYWLDGSVSTALESLNYSAKWSWGNASSHVAFAETSSSAAAEVRLYQSSTIYDALEVDVCAVVKFYYPDGTSTPTGSGPSADYASARVLVADEMIQAPTYYGCDNQQGIITHEWGHALGLAHVSSPTVAVMRVDIAGLSYTIPKVDDVNGLNALY